NSSGQPLLGLDYVNFESATATGTTVVIDGTQADDDITVDANGIVTVRNNLGFINTVDVSAYTRLVLNSLGGNDHIVIFASDLLPGGINVLGGEAGSDRLVLQSTPAAGVQNVEIDSSLVSSTIFGFGARIIDATGVETIRYVGDGGDDKLTYAPFGGA